MNDEKMIKISMNYPDGGERMSLSINTSEKENFMVSINESILCSLEDLYWLREAIDEATRFINKNKKEKNK